MGFLQYYTVKIPLQKKKHHNTIIKYRFILQWWDWMQQFICVLKDQKKVVIAANRIITITCIVWTGRMISNHSCLKCIKRMIPKWNSEKRILFFFFKIFYFEFIFTFTHFENDILMKQSHVGRIKKQRKICMNWSKTVSQSLSWDKCIKKTNFI